jgi:hypothetical protein
MIIKRCFKNKATQAAPYHERLALLDLKTLESRRIISDLVCFDKIHRNKINFKERNKPPVLITNTRGNKMGYVYSHARTNIRKDSFFICVPKIYGKLPENMTSCNLSMEEFKQKLNRLDIVDIANKAIHI